MEPIETEVSPPVFGDVEPEAPKPETIFVVYSVVEVADDASFLVRYMNETFYCSGHPFKAGDRIKISFRRYDPESEAPRTSNGSGG
jgi:hypothetical protein